MNPLALLAFIVGIGTTTPGNKPAKENGPTAAATQDAPQKPVTGQQGDRKPRGGWDGN